MDQNTPNFRGFEATVKESSGYEPPAFEIGRALEHYRRSRLMPYPSLPNTKYNFTEIESGELDHAGNAIIESRWTVILCDHDGKELQQFTFNGDRMRVMKPKRKAMKVLQPEDMKPTVVNKEDAINRARTRKKLLTLDEKEQRAEV